MSLPRKLVRFVKCGYFKKLVSIMTNLLVFRFSDLFQSSRYALIVFLLSFILIITLFVCMCAFMCCPIHWFCILESL